MAMAALEIAVCLALLAMAAGMAIAHKGCSEKTNCIRWGGRFIVAAAALSLLCSVYFGFKYREQGAYDRAYPVAEMMQGHEQMMKMMNKSDPAPKAAPSEEDHKPHH